MPRHPTADLEESLLITLLAGIALHGLLILGFSALGSLAHCWIGSALLLAVFLLLLCKRIGTASSLDRISCFSAWTSPWPWMVICLLVIQIAIYPPTMSDSLCYRLPRLYLALQEGCIARFETPDDRMNGMPWGWEFLAFPLASLNWLNGSKIINLGCWAATYQLLHSFLRHESVAAHRARWVTLLFASAPAFLLQASSTANDLYAFTLLLTGVWFLYRSRSVAKPVHVMGSLLCLVLAANAKPQFLVLGLPWLLWWMFSPQKPWKIVPWWILAIAAPFYVLLSPIPTLLGNLNEAGNLIGSHLTGEGASTPAHFWMVVAGTLQFLAAQLQIPIFPGSGALTDWIARFPGFAFLSNKVGGFHPEWKPVAIIDWASLGLAHFTVLVMGILLATRRNIRSHGCWIGAFLLAFLIAVSQVTPTTIGRSFLGFLALLIPIGALGIASLSSDRLLLAICILGTLAGAITLVMNPSSPLWPAGQVQEWVAKHNHQTLADQLASYNAYRNRAETGAGILDPIPPGHSVGLVLRKITPASPLWQPDWRAHSIRYIDQKNLSHPDQLDLQWLIVGDNAAEFEPEATARFQSLPDWHAVRRHSYLPNLGQGPETWTLYQKARP